VGVNGKKNEKVVAYSKSRKMAKSLKGKKSLMEKINASQFFQTERAPQFIHTHSQKKGTKAVTGPVPFQKLSFCPF